MYANSLIAVSGALFALAGAVPMQHQHHKRDYIWVTVTDEVIVTIPVTETVWVDAGAAVATSPAPQYYAPSSTKEAAPVKTTEAAANKQPYVASPAAPTTSTSAFVAPTPAPTTSSPVAPAPSPEPTTQAAPVEQPAPTTPAYVAPADSTTAAAEPVQSSTTPAYVAPVAAPTAASNSGSSGSNGISGMAATGTSYTGDLTNTDFDIGLGSCGEWNKNSENVVAISHFIFDSYGTANPNNNPTCNKMITITGVDGAKFQARVTDRCPSCAVGSLDLPLPLFNSITNNGDGRVHNMKWEWS